jgi:hypothetical protein
VYRGFRFTVVDMDWTSPREVDRKKSEKYNRRRGKDGKERD